MNKQRTYFGESPRVIVRVDNKCYEYLRYKIGFDNVDELINELVKNHIESRGKYEEQKQQRI